MAGAKKTRAMAEVKVRRSPMEHPRHQYPRETAELEEIASACGLTHAIKWGKPCYMMGAKNIVLVQRFNEYVALLFFKGSLLEDPEHMLHKVGEMDAPRQLRFTSVEEIERQRKTIATFIQQAMALEQTGAKVAKRPVSELEVPAELQVRLDTDVTLKKAFAALTPGRQKGYIFQIAGAKQSATRAARVEKFAPRILAGKGLMD